MTIDNKQVIAHRGGNGRAPENSREAICNAISVGINWIEVDARTTRDGQIVIFHDSTLGRTTNGRGFICRKTLRQLRKYRLANNETIPTLDETLDIVADRANLWIDIKGGIKTAEKIVKIVRAKNAESSVVMSSMRPWVIRRVRSLSDIIKTNLFALFSLYKVWLGKKLGVQFVQPRFLLTKRFFRKANMAKLHVITWPIAVSWQAEIKKVLFLSTADSPAGNKKSKA